MKTEMVKVEQLSKNQFIIRTEKGNYLQSYNKLIAFEPRGGGKILLDNHYWDFSQTTGKYRNSFLGETIEVTREKIKNGVYKLTNLNP